MFKNHLRCTILPEVVLMAESDVQTVELVLNDQLTDLQVLLERDDFLLLLLQEGTQGFHMLQSEFQHHSFLQMTQRLKQEDLR